MTIMMMMMMGVSWLSRRQTRAPAGRNRQQTAVRRKILRREVKRRGSPDFIRVARCLTKALFGALLRVILVRDRNHLGDLLGVQGLQSCSLRKSLLPHNHGGPQMVPHLFAPHSRLRARIVQVTPCPAWTGARPSRCRIDSALLDPG